MKEKDFILIVDDEEGIRKSLGLLLERKGYEIGQAATGKEALAIAQGRPINLALLDIKLPDIEGTQLIAPLQETNPCMPIIMITGFASVESAVQSLTAGAFSYITKPISLDELLLMIKNALDHHHLVIEAMQAKEEIESLAKFPKEDPNPVFRVAYDGALLFANKSAEFILNGWQLSFGTKIPEFIEKAVKETRKSGSRLNLERIEGQKTYLFTIAPVIGQNYVNLYGLDITDRKHAEVALKESENYLKTIFNSAHIGLLIIDPETHVVYDINPAAAEMIGRTSDEVIGRICHEFVCPAERGKCPITDLGQKIDNSERFLLRADGRRAPILTMVVPIVIKGRTYIFESFIDMTERKQAEETIALATRKLALLNDITYQDIQDKITVLRRYVALNNNTSNMAECKSFIEREQSLLAAIHQIIENTKDYQKTGLKQPEWLSVERSIRKGASMISDKDSIKVELDLHGLEIYADTLIDRIFYNLIENTINNGKTATRISFSCKDTTKEAILICEDDGNGIPLIEKDRIFDRDVGGKGRFGLFFAREYLSLFGIPITETGEPEKGARFEINIPQGLYRFPTE